MHTKIVWDFKRMNLTQVRSHFYCGVLIKHPSLRWWPNLATFLFQIFSVNRKGFISKDIPESLITAALLAHTALTLCPSPAPLRQLRCCHTSQHGQDELGLGTDPCYKPCCQEESYNCEHFPALGYHAELHKQLNEHKCGSDTRAVFAKRAAKRNKGKITA